MKHTQAVIFDMDGLMIDSERLTFNLYQHELSLLGHKMTETFYCTLLGRNKKSICDQLLSEYGPNLMVDELWDIVHQKLDYHLLLDKPLKPGLIDLLTYLNENNYKTAVATSSTRERVDLILKTLKLETYFHAIVCGDEVKRSKPNPDIFLKAAEKLSVLPEACLVLEDSEFGLAAAAAAQMKAICIPDMKIPQKSSNTILLNSLTDVINYLSKE